MPGSFVRADCYDYYDYYDESASAAADAVAKRERASGRI